MNIQNRINSGLRNNEQIVFLLVDGAEKPQGLPSGKMITDSDNVSFVYLLDGEDGYNHVYFPEAVWPYMLDVLTTETDPAISWHEERIELPGFKDELLMLIYNIEGNDNYGEAFSSAVEAAFSTILQQTE